MSIEIDDNKVIINDLLNTRAVVMFSLWDEYNIVNVSNNYYDFDLDKKELAQLIAALQAMHDKMEE